MKNIIKSALIATALITAQACSVNTETTYYPDSATSMQSNIAVDPAMIGMMRMNPAAKAQTPLDKLTTDWKSLYDIQKDQLVNLNADSVKVLKKLFMKLNKDNDEMKGISVKYDKLLPAELSQVLAGNRMLRSLPIQNMVNWDGKKLMIDPAKFQMGEILSGVNQRNEAANTPPKTKSDSMMAYGRQMAQGMSGMLRMVDMKMTTTMHFQKPIKNITGKSEYLKRLDNNTVQLQLSSKSLLENSDKDKTTNSKIIIETE